MNLRHILKDPPLQPWYDAIPNPAPTICGRLADPVDVMFPAEYRSARYDSGICDDCHIAYEAAK